MDKTNCIYNRFSLITIIFSLDVGIFYGFLSVIISLDFVIWSGVWHLIFASKIV